VKVAFNSHEGSTCIGTMPRDAPKILRRLRQPSKLFRSEIAARHDRELAFKTETPIMERLARFLGPVLRRPLNRRREAKKLIISAPNGVDEQRYVRIGGIDQWMAIRGEDRDNPALLFLHGGREQDRRCSTH
jgi:hypothetical protein